MSALGIGVVGALAYFFSFLYPRAMFALLAGGAVSFWAEDPSVLLLFLPLICLGYWLDQWSVYYMKVGLDALEGEDDEEDDQHHPHLL